MNIPFRFTGLQSLKIKETDRITALIAELRKLGYAVRSEQDSILLWEGERCPAESAPVIATYEDHRMAMAFAPACIALPQIRIDEPQVVSKSGLLGRFEASRLYHLSLTSPDAPLQTA